VAISPGNNRQRQPFPEAHGWVAGQKPPEAALAADKTSVVSTEKTSVVSRAKTSVAAADKTPDISISSTTPHFQGCRQPELEGLCPIGQLLVCEMWGGGRCSEIGWFDELFAVIVEKYRFARTQIPNNSAASKANGLRRGTGSML
jgi:hypothetical protein